jgi:cysteine desulfurase
MKPLKFFDHNSTTPLEEAARSVFFNAHDELWLNPASPYRSAAQVKVRLDAARHALAGLMEIPAERVVFNSGATEGNNATFAYWSRSFSTDARIGVSPTEHPSVLEAARYYFGDRVQWLPLESNGSVAVDTIDYKNLAAVSVMAANNETGILNQWEKIAAHCRTAGIPYHCDASQWVGKLPSQGLGQCDYLTGCAHKFGGPKGVGFLLVPKELAAFSLPLGGPQEGGHRAGTENVAGILAMVAALTASPVEELPMHRDIFEADLSKALPSVELIGVNAARLWNTSLVLMPDYENVRWIRALEKLGYLVSSGSACASGKVGASPVLSAMGIESLAMRRALRISSGPQHTSSDWAGLLAAIKQSYADLRTENGSSSVINI